MNKLLRMFSLFLVVSLLMTSLPVNALATDVETVPAAENVFESEAILSDELIPVGLPEEEVFAAPIQEAIIEEEPEMDLMQAMGLTAEGEPTPEPENTEAPEIAQEPEETDEPGGEEMPETGIEPETSEEPGAELLPGADLLQGADLLPEITGEPELFPEGEVEEVPVEPEMSVLPGVVYTIGGAGEIAVVLPETAMPVAEVEGLVCDGDYYVNDTGVVLTTAWLDTLAPGEVLVCILGADGVLYVQPVVAVEMVINNTEVDYDIVNLRVNGEDLFAGSGTNWTYDAETGVLTLTGESTVSGSGVVQSVDVATDAAITLSSLELTVGNAAAFTCNTLENSAVNLVLTGENTVAAANLTSAEALSVSGEGSLTTDNITCADFTWAAGTLNVKTLTQTGMLTVNAGTANVSGNGASAIVANDMTIAAGAQVIVKAAPSVEAFTAVQVANTITNSGTLDIDILSGTATEVYGIKATTYSGDADVLNITNSQTHMAAKVYGVYAGGDFTDKGTITFINKQPSDMLHGVYAKNIYFLNFDARTEGAVAEFTGLRTEGMYSDLDQYQGGKATISLDNCMGINTKGEKVNSYGIRGAYTSLAGEVSVTAEKSHNVRAVNGGYSLGCADKVDVRLVDCMGDLMGIVASTVYVSPSSECSVYMDGGETAKGLQGYTIELYGKVDIKIENVTQKVEGIHGSHGSQTYFYSCDLKVDVFNNPCESVGAYGDIEIRDKNAKVYIVAKQIGYENYVCEDYGNKNHKLKGIIIECANGKVNIVSDYTYIELDGVSYPFYPGLVNASGENWSIDAETNTLTLDNYTGKTLVWRTETDEINVVLKGENILNAFDSYALKTVFSGSGSLRISAGSADNIAGIVGRDIAFNGGQHMVEGFENGIYADNISVDGAELDVSGCTVGLWVRGTLDIGASADMDIRAGYRALIADQGWTLNGEAMQECTDSRMVIAGGEIGENTVENALCVGGQVLYPDMLSQDHSGEGWAWKNADQALVLSGYAGVVSCRGFDLKIIADEENDLAGLYVNGLTLDSDTDGIVYVSTFIADGITVNGGEIRNTDDDPLTLSHLTVTDGCVITGDVKVNGDIAVSGGELNAAGISADKISVTGGASVFKKTDADAITVSGGEAAFEDADARTIDISGGMALFYGESSLDVGSITVSGGQMLTENIVSCESYTQTGGEVQLCMDGNLNSAAIPVAVTAGSFSATGGLLIMINLSKEGVVLKADSAVFGGTLTAQLVAADSLFEVASLNICGAIDAAGAKVIHIDSGEIVYTEVLGDALLFINGTGYSQYALSTMSFGGKGWSWNPMTRTLTLSNYSGGKIRFGYADAKLHLAPGTLNTVTGGIESPLGLTVTGEGALHADITNAMGALVLKNKGMMRGDIYNGTGNLTMTNVNLNVGEIYVEKGNLTISKCYMDCACLYAPGGSISVKDSSVLSGPNYYEGEKYADIHAKKGMKVTSSVMLYNYKTKNTKFSYDKNTALFRINERTREYELVRDATLKHTFLLPDEDINIPKGKKLTIASGKTLYFMSDNMMFTYGKNSIKGNVVNAWDAYWKLTGSTKMASGSSHKLVVIDSQDKKKTALHPSHWIWTSSDTSVATVDSTGLVTVSPYAKAGDEVTIGVRSRITSDTKTSTLKITVTPGVSKIELKRDNEKVDELELWLDPANKTAQLTAKVRPSDASREVTWKSTKSKVASVSADGVVTAKAAGTAYIYAVANDGTGVESQRVKVTVKKAPTSVKFTSTSATLGYDAEEGVGSSKQLKVKLSSGSASTITYKSSNAEVVTVDENGVITAKKAGKATITATTYNKKKATCKVTVKGAPDSIEINKAEHVMGLGDEYTFTAKIPSGSYGNWTFSSSDAAKVSVDAQTGAAKAEALGEAVITAASFNGKTDSCKVTVVPAPDGIKAPENLTLGKGETRYLNAEPTLTGDQATATTFTYSTSNKKVVTVDANGKLRAMATGKAVITIMTHNEVTATCEVVVKKAPTSIKLSHKKGVLAHDEKLNLGTAYQLTAKLSSGSASAIKFTSSNTKVAKVDENGLITTVGVGTAKIKAMTFNKKYATCTVTVMPAPENMIFGKDSYVVAVDDKITVEAEAEFGTYSPTVEYGSKDLFVAMVDKDTGLVTPTDIGTTTLTATGFNGAAGTVEIKVVNSPDTLALNAYKGTLKVGKKFTIVPTVTRTDLKETTATYTFRSNKPSVCTVSASGKLVGRKKGTAVITVRTHNGLEATVRVTVK